MNMIDSYLRSKLVSLLAGNVPYNDGNGFNGIVPVREGGNGDIENDYEIFIGEYSDGGISGTKQTFGSNASQLIEVVARNATTKKHASAILGLVANIIHPTPSSNILSGGGFDILIIGKPSFNSLPHENGDGTQNISVFHRYYLKTDHN